MAAVDSRKDTALFHQRIQNNNQRTHFSKKCKWEKGEWRERTELRRKWGEAIHDRRRLCCKCTIFRRRFLKHKSTRNGISTRNRATTTLSRSDDVAPMVARGLGTTVVVCELFRQQGFFSTHLLRGANGTV